MNIQNQYWTWKVNWNNAKLLFRLIFPGTATKIENSTRKRNARPKPMINSRSAPKNTRETNPEISTKTLPTIWSTFHEILMITTLVLNVNIQNRYWTWKINWNNEKLLFRVKFHIVATKKWQSWTQKRNARPKPMINSRPAQKTSRGPIAQIPTKTLRQF